MSEEIIFWMIVSAVILGVIFLLLLFILALTPPRRNSVHKKQNYHADPERRDVEKDLKKIKEQISGDEESW